MPDTQDDAVTTIAFGAAGHYVEHESHASLCKAPRHEPIRDVVIVCPPDRVIRADELLVQHPPVIQALARQYVEKLVVVVAPEGIEDQYIETPYLGGMLSSEDPQFFPNLLEIATGESLIRAIHAQFHGFGVGEGEFTSFAGDHDELGIIDSAQVLDVLRESGIQAIRFTEYLDHPLEGQGHFWHVLDQQIVRRPAAAHFALDFVSHPTADAMEAADALNRQWFVLDDEAREIVQKVVGICRRDGGRITQAFREGEVIADPIVVGGISWDVDDGQGTLARGVQRLPVDAKPAICGVDELRTIAASWDRLSDVASEAKDPVRARDLLAASTWHLKAVALWQSASDKPFAEPLRDRLASEPVSLDRSPASFAVTWNHEVQQGWKEAEAQRAAAISAEEQAAHDTIANCHHQICEAVIANCEDPAWLKRFDTAGWPNVDERTAANTFTAFLIELHAIHEARANAVPAQQDAPVLDRGRGR